MLADGSYSLGKNVVIPIIMTPLCAYLTHEMLTGLILLISNMSLL